MIGRSVCGTHNCSCFGNRFSGSVFLIHFIIITPYLKKKQKVIFLQYARVVITVIIWRPEKKGGRT